GRDLLMRREGADAYLAVADGDVAERGDAAYVNERAGLGEAELHERQERVAAGEHLRVLRAAERLHRLLDRRRSLVVEVERDHRRTSFAASCITRHTRS